jgi:type VI secretion system secreted protein VgrG
MAELKTPLGDNVLALASFSGTEELGKPFEFHVDAVSEQENIDFDQALGQACTIKLKTFQQKERFFCGMLTRAQWGTDLGRYSRYRLELRPWYFLLGHQAGCRIFLKMDVRDIIQDIFQKAGFSSGTDFEFRTTGNYDKIEYCVQYRETDLAFTSRLMEEYGIYYYFEHADGRHKMVLADSPSSHSKIPDLQQLRYHAETGAFKRIEQQLSSWVSERRFSTGKVEYNDYDYLKPSKQLRAPKEASANYARSKLEIYDYPGKHDDQDKGTRFAQFRLEAEQAADHRRIADGDAPSLFSGGLVDVEKHPTAAENKLYLVVRADHRFGTQAYRSASGEASEPSYSGTYVFLPGDTPFRSLPSTPKPRIYGIQTAKVVPQQGEDDEEISTDEHGRIWVQFYWDREPQKSCPIRVAQVHASKQWGGQFIPRVGMEVVVQFIEGDPDRPLVTGVVYNGDNRYPYDLPANKTQHGWKSDSSKGHVGYSEFMFDDKAESELIRMHAEKDHDVTIKNAQTHTIGEEFMPPKGSPSRSALLKSGDDQLTIQTGDRTVSIPMGSQNTTAMLTISDTVGLTSVSLTPAAKNVAAPMINHTAQAVINHTAGAVINHTAPLINLNGVVLINGMVPVLIPV